jgi:hypothetical protein
MLRWWLFGEDLIQIWRGEYYVSIKVICLLLLVIVDLFQLSVSTS